MLKGQAGTQVKILTSRNGQAPELRTITREEIKIPDVPYKGFVDEANKVGYLKLNISALEEEISADDVARILQTEVAQNGIPLTGLLKFSLN